ncbi:MAG: Paraquat-inducible protein B [uncultured Sulfurovum sp.]|uniref:Paraquat-inducible protein B n=1 Tax=uncultured Sulfurovum sp. TaxID=269237 RepID=A0A6S6S3P5_9BACT|nr:MAG: Paraquat-inducible protein B [uncultured Sulfurovum sp.]
MSKQLPKIEESTKFNFFTSIWIVPFIALIIAGWLAYQYFSELGSEIRIVFPENVGLKAGQSHIKYRNVPIGTIKKIELQEDGEGVTVVVRMDKGTDKYLNENTKFWIVKPEVGVTGVSGLETIISGTYIDMFSEDGEEFQNKFIGMSHAFRQTNEGEYFSLSAPVGYNIRKGTPLYFKNLKVGHVEYINISLDSTAIEFIVFIEKFYVPYVHTDSKFWVISAMNVDFSHGNLDVNMAPLSNLLHGGIAFSSSGEDVNRRLPHAYMFHLHKNASVAESKQIGKGGKAMKRFSIEVEESIAKLKRDASVQYNGFDVGHVEDIELSYNNKSHKMLGNITVNIDTSAFKDNSDKTKTGEENFYAAVKEGLRVKIAETDPITGILFVDLVFEESNITKEIVASNGYPLLPISTSKSEDIMAKVEQILNKINTLPLDGVVTSVSKLLNNADILVVETNSMIKGVNEPLTTVLSDLKTTIKNLNTMSNKKSFINMPDEISKSLVTLTDTLKTAKKVVKGYDEKSLISRQLSQTLQVVTKVSQEMQAFLKMLNRKPNSLIFGDK